MLEFAILMVKGIFAIFYLFIVLPIRLLMKLVGTDMPEETKRPEKSRKQRSEFIIEGKNVRPIKIENNIPSQKQDLSINNWGKMPGVRATLRDQPDSVLRDLESEGRVKDMELLREIVTRICQLAPCKVGDANPTRALAISIVGTKGRRTRQFFAILTDQHKGFHKKDNIGPRGFSIQVATRKGAGAKPPGTNWVCDRFDYIKKGNQVWWRNELRDAALDVNSIVDEVKKARNTFLSE